MTSLSDNLRARADERNEKYTVGFVERWPNLLDFDTLIYCGNFSWTLPITKWRFLYTPSVVDIGNGPQTPGDVTRDYLDFKYPKRLKATRAQKELITQHRSFPALANRTSLKDAVYVDLKSAYWSVILSVGWDVDYFPGRWIGVSSSNADFPLSSNKPARSGLVTAGLSSPIRYWDGKTLRWKMGNNEHINYGLWAIVQDVLHGIAAEVERAGAAYIHTDGYIVPRGKLSATMNIISDWGLKAGIKAEGPAEIYGVGIYSIGDSKTKRVGGFSPGGFRNISPVHSDWLKSSFSRWAARGPLKAVDRT